MLNTILGSKVKMSQAFAEDKRFPVTVVKAGPCVVTGIKNSEKDGYWAVQLGFSEKKIKNISKPVIGHLKPILKEGIKLAPRYLREVRLVEKPELNVGDEVKASDIFNVGDEVKVTGISKGKGFAGVVKRHHFKGGPRTHGQSDRERAPGSIGSTTTPGRVLKGKRMAGRMGQDRITVKNLKVVSIDAEKNEISLSGPIPGSKDSLVILTKTAGEPVAKREVEKVEEPSFAASSAEVASAAKAEKATEGKEVKEVQNG